MDCEIVPSSPLYCEALRLVCRNATCCPLGAAGRIEAAGRIHNARRRAEGPRRSGGIVDVAVRSHRRGFKAGIGDDRRQQQSRLSIVGLRLVAIAPELQCALFGLTSGTDAAYDAGRKIHRSPDKFRTPPSLATILSCANQSLICVEMSPIPHGSGVTAVHTTDQHGRDE